MICNELPRLFTATDKVAQRLQRFAHKAYAVRNNISYLDLEREFQIAREVLRKIVAQSSKPDEADGLVSGIINLTRCLIRSPEAIKVLPFQEIATVEVLANLTEQLWARMRLQMLPRVTFPQAQAFIGISDLIREGYLSEQYDPTDVICPESYAAAHLVVANFDAYDRALR